jgi:hypothetical protein
MSRSDLLLDFTQLIRRQAVRYGCSQSIFCPKSGKILDVDHAVLVTIRHSGQTFTLDKGAFFDFLAGMGRKGELTSPDSWKAGLEVWDGETGEDLSASAEKGEASS